MMQLVAFDSLTVRREGQGEGQGEGPGCISQILVVFAVFISVVHLCIHRLNDLPSLCPFSTFAVGV